MSKKRGQLTIFILIAIVIIIAIVVVFYFINSMNRDDSNEKSEEGRDYFESSGDIMESVDFCVEYTAKNALVLIAFQGGYYDMPNRAYSSGAVFFPYYYYEGSVLFPELETIEKELGKYVDDAIVNCIDGYYENYELSFSSPRTYVEVQDDDVYFVTDMLITLSGESDVKNVEVKEHDIHLNSSLYDIYKVAEFFSKSHEKDSEYYCINCFARMLKERDLYGYIFPDAVGSDVSGVMIYENRTEIGFPYVYIFLNKYTGDEKSPYLYSDLSVYSGYDDISELNINDINFDSKN